MAFFNRNKKIKKKKGNAPEENQITSAEIARQRAEDIQSNYDSDDQFIAAQERWQRAKEEISVYIEQMN